VWPMPSSSFHAAITTCIDGITCFVPLVTKTPYFGYNNKILQTKTITMLLNLLDSASTRDSQNPFTTEPCRTQQTTHFSFFAML
jgi:hypothetical protein